MQTARAVSLLSVVLLAAVLAAQGAAAQTTYTLKVATNSPSYYGDQTILVTGSVSPAPGPSTGVTLKIINPAGDVVAVGEADVGATSGLYNYTFVAGGSAGWVAGTFEVNATWGAYAPQIYAQAKFTYTLTAPTTTTSSATSTTTTSSSATSSSTTTTTSSTTTTTTTTSTTTPSTSQATSATSSGGIPVFPFGGALTALFVALLLSAYILARRFMMGPRSSPAL